MTSRGAIIIRDALDPDMMSVQTIYAHHVLNGLASFEETPPSVETMAARRAAVLDAHLPFLVAEIAGEVVGYCYAAPYHARAAWRFTIEDSIYVRAGRGGAGIGGALLGALIERCEAGPWRQMVAVIGDSGNAGSIALHRRHGFAPVGVLKSTGLKHGLWVDVVLMQRSLGAGDTTSP